MNFETLANENKDAVYRQLIRACGNREDAEDVLIDALLKAYRNLAQLRDSAAFRSWLAQIGRRVCWQLKQREALRPVLQLSAMIDEGQQLAADMEPPDVQAAKAEMKDLLRQAVEQLEPAYRDVYELRDINGMSGEAVARRLGISLTAMKSRLHRARESVRNHLDDALVGSGSRKSISGRGNHDESTSRTSRGTAIRDQSQGARNRQRPTGRGRRTQ